MFKRFSFKSFICGLIIFSILLSGITIFGADLSKTIKVYFNKVNIRLNDILLSSDRITYNNETYVNIKDVAKALNRNLVYDKNGNINLKYNYQDTQPQNSIIKTKLPLSSIIENVTVKINKVEQNSDSLKIYITYINHTDSEISISDGSSKIISNGKQYEYDISFNSDRSNNKQNIEIAPFDIEPNISENSTLFFKPIQNVKKIDIILYADYKEFRFNNVEVKNIIN